MPTRISGEEESNSQFLSKPQADTHYVNQTGDTMNGVLNMNLNKLTGLPTPSDTTDAVSKNYVDSRTKVYGFQLSKTITATDYDTYITVTVPIGVDPNRIMLICSHPYLQIIHYRGLTITGTGGPTSTQFRIVFIQPRSSDTVDIKLEGLIYILPSIYLSLTGKSIQLSIGSETSEVICS